MLKKIESLRKKPRHVRNRYAFWTALIFTLILGVVWGTTLPARFTYTTENATNPESLGDFNDALGGISTNLSETLSTIRTEAELYQAQSDKNEQEQEEGDGVQSIEQQLEAAGIDIQKTGTPILIGTSSSPGDPKDE